jgi:hypothetical protein
MAGGNGGITISNIGQAIIGTVISLLLGVFGGYSASAYQMREALGAHEKEGAHAEAGVRLDDVEEDNAEQDTRIDTLEKVHREDIKEVKSLLYDIKDKL